MKLETVDDSLEEEHAPLNKRSKLWNNGITTAKFNNLLDEPSPLGLNLRKSPSFQELIRKKLSESSDTNSQTQIGSGFEKLKASNFTASVLRIGQWEYNSRYEGDLVAKCYFAKHKLVWEVLQQGLKSKIEIQWSDITALKANLPEDGPGTLTLGLARRPLFYRETNPQPRKHTLWQAASDFTNGQASMNRQHFLQCPNGILNKHFEKLVQCDDRLFHLSRQQEIKVEPPFFDVRKSIFEEISVASPVVAQSSSEHMSLSHELLSPSSGEGGVDSRNTTDWSHQMKVSGLNPSISINDFLALFSDQACTNNPEFEEMKQLLLSDTHTDTSDEKSVMSKVNSFCNLLQSAENSDTGFNHWKEIGGLNNITEGDRVNDPASSGKLQVLSRRDSLSDLLAQLPRVSSLPKFLFDISEDGGNAYYR